MRRTILSVFVLVLAVAGGFLLRGLIITPEEAVLPVPEAEVITAEVATRALSTEFTGTGSVAPASTVEVRPVEPSTGGAALVTGVPLSAGESVQWCQPLIEISDRPLLVLAGAVNAHRDIGEGDEGADVRRLQDALVQCGHAVTVDGRFGPQTASAVRRLYVNAGYSVITRPEVLEELPESAAGNESGEATDAAPPAPVKPRDLVVVPASELLFLAGESHVSTVVDTKTVLGGDPVATLMSGNMNVNISLPAAVRTAVEGGEPLNMSIGQHTLTTELPVPPVAPTMSDAGEPLFPVRIELENLEPPITPDEAVAWTLTVGHEHEHELVVPVTAIFVQTDGTSAVVVVADDSTETIVPVTIVDSAGGFVAVDGAVAVGDQVKVGVQ